LSRFPQPPEATVPRKSSPRMSWPLFNRRVGRNSVSARIHSPIGQTRLGRGIVSERTMDTRSPPGQGFFRSLFRKSGPGAPTGPLPTTRFDDGKEQFGRERRRKYCGLPIWVVIVSIILL